MAVLNYVKDYLILLLELLVELLDPKRVYRLVEVCQRVEEIPTIVVVQS